MTDETLTLTIGPKVVRALIAAELARLERRRPDSAPFGGWRNRAVENVADLLGQNPYDVDRIARTDP